MKVEDYLNSKKIWEGTYVTDQSASENYFNLKNLIEEYARIQIEKDREETKRLMNDKLKDFEGMNPEIEAIIDRHIILD
jgi:hypothetical protein